MFSDNTTYIPARAGEAKITLADISKTKKYGYNPKQSIKLYIEKFLAN